MNTICDILNDSTTSRWLKFSLETALQRDPVDAANDAELMAKLLRDHAEKLITNLLENSKALSSSD